MIRRCLRSLNGLSKKLSRVTLIGGEETLTDLSMGYYSGANGLQLCPAPSAKPITSLSAKNLLSVERRAFFTLLHYADGVTNLFGIGTPTSNIVTLPQGEPFAVVTSDGDRYALLSIVCENKQAIYELRTGEIDVYDLPYRLFGGIAHCGRMFAVDKADRCKVVWSGLRVTDWEDKLDGSGYINLKGDNGEIQKLENFGDDILCVLKQGFAVIRGFADSRNYRISPSQFSVNVGLNINVGGVWGGKYYYSTVNGLQSYNGETINMEYAVNRHLTDVGRVYVLGDGYVYANCTYNGEECLMRYDPQSGNSIFFGKGCTIPFFYKGETYCVKGGKFYSLSPKNTEEGRIWRSQPIGGCGKKTLKYLYVDGEGTPEFTVVSERGRLNVKGTGRIPVNLVGEKIYVEISGNTPVRSVVAELEERR